MSTSRLRQMLTVEQPHLFLSQVNNVISFGKRENTEELLEALVDDFKDGFFNGYLNPTLHAQFNPYNEDDPLRLFSMEDDYQAFINQLEELNRAVKNGDRVLTAFKLGDNWKRSKYDVMACFFGNYEHSVLCITPQTKTEHLIPFIDAEVKDKKIIIYSDKITSLTSYPTV